MASLGGLHQLGLLLLILISFVLIRARDYESISSNWVKKFQVKQATERVAKMERTTQQIETENPSDDV